MHIDSFPKIRLLFVVFIAEVLFCVSGVNADWLTTSRFHSQRAGDFADDLDTDGFRNLSSAAAWALDSDDGPNFDYFFDRTASALSTSDYNDSSGVFYRETDSDALPDQAIPYSMNRAASASSIALSTPYSRLPWISLKNHDLVLTGSGQTTLNLWNLIVKDGTLTLQGAVGTDFIINVRNKFSLSNSAKIVLSGGLQPSDVQFDILGAGPPVLIRQHSSLTGFIEAVHRVVRITTDSQVTGGVTARKVQLRKGGKIISAPVVSPEKPE